jgi:hypothetical protein
MLPTEKTATGVALALDAANNEQVKAEAIRIWQ